MRRPSALSPGHMPRARVSFTTTTGTEPARSSARIPRPSTSSAPSAANVSAVTVRKATLGRAFPERSGRSSMAMGPW